MTVPSWNSVQDNVRTAGDCLLQIETSVSRFNQLVVSTLLDDPHMWVGDV